MVPDSKRNRKSPFCAVPRYPALLGATLLLVLVAAPVSASAPSSAGHEGHGQEGPVRTSSPGPAVSPLPVDGSGEQSQMDGHDMGDMQKSGGEAESTTRGPVLAGFAVVNVAALGTAFVLKRRSSRRRRDPQPRETGERRSRSFDA
ncbi:MAG: hypothetical protein Q8P61_03765 [Candidatus Nanopelagicales bacterium]|nr:hypothetical protein [Candidatus Nanopelagicales bacterium]